jgi:glycosyltransferase involved in cell wall biosynthesis
MSPSRSRISIALCTYNGAAYLSEQLDSFARQTRLPDELVVCDDASSDDTRGLVQRFASQSPFPVRLIANPRNLRSTKNFEQAISLCHGDIICLSDQDDSWEREKIERIESFFRHQPDAGFVFSNAWLVDHSLVALDGSLWEAVGFSRAEQQRFLRYGFGTLLRWNRVTGATMAFPARMRSLVLPIPANWVHDAWIALVLAAVGAGYPLDGKLIRYRQHISQQIGERRRSWLSEYRIARDMPTQRHVDDVTRYQQLRDHLAGLPDVPAERCSHLDAKIAHLRFRASLRESRRWRAPAVLAEFLRGRYRRVSRGWKAAAQDLLLP